MKKGGSNMSIEVSSKRLGKNELVKVLEEMFACTKDWDEKHMDKRFGGAICTRGKQRSIPFFKNPTPFGRKELEKDFEDFLSKEGVVVESGGNSFILVNVLLGRSSGMSRSYFVADEKQIEIIARKYTDDFGGFVLVIPHFSEKTADNSAMVEHAHILYRFPFGVSENPPFEEFLSEQYEED